MNYAREELLRQRVVLERLLSGAAAEVEREEEAPAESGGGMTGLRKRGDKRMTSLMKRDEEILQISGLRRGPLPAERAVGLDHFSAVPEYQTWEAAASHGFAGEKQTAVRDVSRFIQRDSRRYDGGFSIY